MRLPAVQVDTEYVNFAGGIDRISNAMAIKPGFAIDAMNYEAGVNGGYRRIDGFERVDGRAAPSAGSYSYVSVSSTVGLSTGSGILGATSGATAIVAYIGAGVLALTRIVGTFVVGESISTGGGGLPLLVTMTYARTTIGTITSTLVDRGSPTPFEDAVALNAAADVYRAIIDKVPGAGSVRGVNMLKGVLYAWRDNWQQTACLMWKATSTGWQNIPLGNEMAFTSGGTSEIVEGYSVVGLTSLAGGVVRRVVLESGSWAGGTAAGRLIFGDTFFVPGLIAGEGLTAFPASAVPATFPDMATCSGPATPIVLLPGGRYEVENFNFSGSTDTLRMYGADGVNRGFESDGTTFVPIRTGMVVDTPVHAHAHKNQLFFSFRGSSQNSGIGKPYQWTAVVGAGEIGVGDDITGYVSQTGDVLAIFSRNRSDQLQGSSVADFVLKPLSTKAGAIPYTTQTLGGTYYLDDPGLRQITRTQDYGSFNDDPVSEIVQPIIDLFRGKAVASSVYRIRSQYRVYGNDGSGLAMSFKGRQSVYGGIVQTVVGITQFQYPVNVTCACSGEDATGKDVVFFGADNGYVYQGDKGSSFDGEEIEAFLRLPFNHSKSPRTRKRYRKGVLDITSIGYSAIRFTPEFTYGDSDVQQHRAQTAAIAGVGGYYDSAIYEQIIYDGRLVNSPEFSIEGTGTNISLLFYNKSDIDLGHLLQGSMIHFTPRRLAR